MRLTWIRAVPNVTNTLGDTVLNIPRIQLFCESVDVVNSIAIGCRGRRAQSLRTHKRREAQRWSMATNGCRRAFDSCVIDVLVNGGSLVANPTITGRCTRNAPPRRLVDRFRTFTNKPAHLRAIGAPLCSPKSVNPSHHDLGHDGARFGVVLFAAPSAESW